jgi:aerobic carbon-monoxide dehydrogenase medium subunit
MIHTQFDYKAPRNLKKAIELLSTGNACIIAGGTSLMNAVRSKKISPSLLVDLKKIRDVKGITLKKPDGILTIRSMTTLSEIADSPKVVKYIPLLTEAINSINDPQYKNRATIGGNIAFNDASSDVMAVLMVLNATINTTGKDGDKKTPIDSFAAKNSEIIVSVDIPLLNNGAMGSYIKFKNPANQTAVCGIAVLLEKTKEGVTTCCRIAITGAASSITRLKIVEPILEGKILTTEIISEAVTQLKTETIVYRNDAAASAEYRKHLAEVLTERAVLKAAGI